LSATTGGAGNCHKAQTSAVKEIGAWSVGAGTGAGASGFAGVWGEVAQQEPAQEVTRGAAQQVRARDEVGALAAPAGIVMNSCTATSTRLSKDVQTVFIEGQRVNLTKTP